MEYLGIQLEEENAWTVTAFNNFLKMLKEEKGVEYKDEQKALLFVAFYSGVLYEKSRGL